MYTGRYLAYCAVHHLTPGQPQRDYDMEKWGHRNYGLIVWDGFNELFDKREYY